MSAALYAVAKHFGSDELMRRPERSSATRSGRSIRSSGPGADDLKARSRDLRRRRVQAFSLVRALRTLGMRTALVGTQTGDAEDYNTLREMCDPGTIVVDDSNPIELAKFCLEQDVDLFIGGVKERPIAYKLGIGSATTPRAQDAWPDLWAC